jgi:hypothetical protein
MLPGLDRNKFEDALVQCFQAADPDNAGVLDVPAIMEAILGSSLNLTQKQVTALANAVVDADYSDVVYNKVIDVAWDLLLGHALCYSAVRPRCWGMPRRRNRMRRASRQRKRSFRRRCLVACRTRRRVRRPRAWATLTQRRCVHLKYNIQKNELNLIDILVGYGNVSNTTHAGSEDQKPFLNLEHRTSDTFF